MTKYPSLNEIVQKGCMEVEQAIRRAVEARRKLMT